jgi:hypothetical protein
MKNQENQNTTFHNGVGTPIMKTDLIDRLKVEVQDAKNRRQPKLWAFWHYNSNQMQFMDENKQFRMMKDLYKQQGFNYNPDTSKDMPELAKELGSLNARRNIYLNTSSKSNDLPLDPLSMMVAGRMNGAGEFVILEFTI